jgi:uncharacterized membrane protein YeaQ/YmgE (transglycosylase-associated protein family)
MSLLGLLILLVVAGICGAIAELVVGFSPGGFVVSIVVGIIGAYLGTALAGYLNLPPFLTFQAGGQTLDIMWAILGSILLLLIISLFRGAGRRRRLF